MRLRFSIRDLLWLTLVAALASGWWLDHLRERQSNFVEVMKLVDRMHVPDRGPLVSLPEPPRSAHPKISDESVEKAMQIEAIKSQGIARDLERAPQMIESRTEFTPGTQIEFTPAK